jgi:hypothetical protein
MDVEQIADGLYGLPPPEFTAAREEAAARARAGGEPVLADRVHRLRRPTLAAWLANLLVREHPQEMRGLLELASGLREAQARLDGAQLRELTQRRRAVVSALTSQAARAATRAGLTVGEGPLNELEQTLHTALTDQAVADAVASGRLTGTRDLGNAPDAGLNPSQRGGRTAPGPRVPARARGRTGDDRRRELTQAQQLSARAAEQAGAAEAAAGKARDQLERATEQRQRLREQVERLAERLDRLRADERGAAAAEREARARVDSTDREARRARGRARDAADRLHHLDQRAA